MRSVQHFINGEFAVSASGQTFDKRSPLDNAVIARIAEGGAAEVDAAVAAARAALHGDWARLGSDKRLALLHAVADEMTRRFDDFVAAEEADTGQPHHVIAHAFVPRGAANFKIF
uniref:aldehyde dehydrogenase family protein n=1 Tax=Methylibium sp. TaxID=2067992 RepID=UPI002869FE48